MRRRALGVLVNAVINVLILVGIVRRMTRYTPPPRKGLYLESPPRRKPRGLDRL